MKLHGYRVDNDSANKMRTVIKPDVIKPVTNIETIHPRH